jgi:hypothetical protein
MTAQGAKASTATVILPMTLCQLPMHKFKRLSSDKNAQNYGIYIKFALFNFLLRTGMLLVIVGMS